MYRFASRTRCRGFQSCDPVSSFDLQRQLPNTSEPSAPPDDPHASMCESAKKWIGRDRRFRRDDTTRTDAAVDDHLRDDRRRRASVDIDADSPLGHTTYVTVEDVF